jgi:uncharacterized repeat protein (TIGR01451 family)
VKRSAWIAALALFLALPASASAQHADGQGTDRFVTAVARECPTYTDITANRARNDIQESLEDLGADTPYQAGQPIDPGIESANQPNCAPITNWTFTLGESYKTRAVSGPWGSLSIVTSPYSPARTTVASTPLLDYAGRPTGQDIEGAVTFELTEAQAARAARANSLWIQGGTPSDPILNARFPGVYGFGALRCAVDNLNGDNVEWIAYPQGTEHVFCYAYYVKPPPTSGTITIRKEVRSAEPATQTFSFDGNLSFNEGGNFNLRVTNGQPASERFYRAARAEPWTVRELVPEGWQLDAVNCSGSRGSSFVTDVAAGTAAITLAARDEVTCTFVNRVAPPAGNLFLNKLTRGALGTFDFTVRPVGGGDPVGASATTQEEAVPVAAEPSPVTLSPGRYSIDERLPESRRGRWERDAVICDGVPEPDPASVEVSITNRGGATCTFENRFIPRGRISIDKVTLGGTTTAGFVIWPVDDPETRYRKAATTTAPDVPARAKGTSTRNLELGSYVIQELEPRSNADTNWSLVQVVCNGKPYAAVEGRVVVTLTAAAPREHCRFTNAKTPVPQPPQPPDPHVPGGPDPDLVVSKLPDRRVVTAGETITYRVVVRNRGPVAAEGVIVADVLALRAGRAQATVLSASARGRPCNKKVLYCNLRTVRAGASVTSKVTIRTTRAGVISNSAVANSDALETRYRNNLDSARVRVRPAAFCPPLTASLLRPRARAAC